MIHIVKPLDAVFRRYSQATVTQASIGIAYRRSFGVGEHLDEIERPLSHSALKPAA